MASGYDKQRILDELKRSAWLGGLPAELQRELVDLCTLQTYERDAIIINENSPANGLYTVVDGQIGVSRRISDNSEFLFYIGGPGFCYGEIAVLTDLQTVVTVTARTRVVVLYLSKPSFTRLAEIRPAYYRFISEMLAHRLADALQVLAQSTMLTTERFLSTRLARIAELWRRDSGCDDIVDLAISQADLARMLGVSRQIVNRYLKKLQAQGLIEVGFRSVRILEPEKLKEIDEGAAF